MPDCHLRVNDRIMIVGGPFPREEARVVSLIEGDRVVVEMSLNARSMLLELDRDMIGAGIKSSDARGR